MSLRMSFQPPLRNGCRTILGMALVGVLVHPGLQGADLGRRNELVRPVAVPVDIDIQVLENDVRVAPTRKNAGLWWLCGGMIGYTIASEINQSRSRKAGQLGGELAELMNDLDCRSALVRRFEGGLNPAVIPIIGEVRCSKVQAGEAVPAGPAGRSPELLSVQYCCGLDDELTSLRVTMKAVVWTQPLPVPIDSLVEEQVRELTKYYQEFTYEISLAEPPATKDQVRRAGAWLALGTDNLRSRILAGMTLLADALAFDLGCPGAGGEVRDPLSGGFILDGPGTPQTAGEGTRRWRRSDSGEITIHERI